MSANVDRIMAQKDMRSLTVANAAGSEQSAKSYRERLEIETGTIVKAHPAALNAQRDEAGIEELRTMAKSFRLSK